MTPIILPAVHPNVGLRYEYQRRLDRLVAQMARSLDYWLAAKWKANAPEIALDASPAMEMRTLMRTLAQRWRSRFSEAAPELAAYFAKSATERVDGELSAHLKKAGIAVEWRATKRQNDVYQAMIGEQVALIKSIASEHLSDVEGMVMRSVQEGRNLGDLTKNLEARYGVTRRRAALIARDQNNKATAILTRVRQADLGVKRARWLHSAGGKTPRPEHVAFSGSMYEIAKGAYLEGKWVWPGTEINCRCVSRTVLEGF